MKNTLTILALTTGLAAADSSDYVNFVRQIQQDSGVEWDVTVDPTGSMLSPEGVGPDGSLFQLWSVHNLTASEYHLDEEFVSAYTPDVEITIHTGDPYPHIARTRADQAFTVRVRVTGLVRGPNVPLVAGQVLFSHAAGLYPEGMHAFPEGSEDNHLLIDSSLVSRNGNYNFNYGMTNLRGPDLTKVEGEEVWTVSALEGPPYVQGEMLESATLQVWPIADATISGIDTAEKYEELPPITVTLNDLYPDSTTHVRVYRGAPSPNPENPEDVQSSFVIIDDSIPQDRVVTLNGIDSLFDAPGAYTVEIVHETPFGVELLQQFYPLNIKRTISVRGSVYSK